jgi:HEAT repeats
VIRRADAVPTRAGVSLSVAVAGLVVAGLVAPAAAGAQLAERVDQLENGMVRFTYAARAGVEICDQGVRMGEHHWQWRTRDSGDRASNCRTGTVELEMRVRDGRVRALEIVRGTGAFRDAEDSWDGEDAPDGDGAEDGMLDLGDVDPTQASVYLLSLAYDAGTEDAAEDAVFPAMLSDAPEAWRGLVGIARDHALPDGVRKNALFWLGQEAAESITDDLVDVARGEHEDQDIRNAAIFALSQRDDEASIPLLMDLARTAEQSETRKQAMFWLAQSDDARVVPFFEGILLERIVRDGIVPEGVVPERTGREGTG